MKTSRTGRNGDYLGFWQLTEITDGLDSESNKESVSPDSQRLKAGEGFMWREAMAWLLDGGGLDSEAQTLSGMLYESARRVTLNSAAVLLFKDVFNLLKS